MSFFKMITEQGLGEMTKGQTILRVTKDRQLEKAMITHVQMGQGTELGANLIKS